MPNENLNKQQQKTLTGTYIIALTHIKKRVTPTTKPAHTKEERQRNTIKKQLKTLQESTNHPCKTSESYHNQTA